MMKTLTSYLIVLPAIALTFACGEPAGAEQTVQGGLAPKGKVTKPTPKQIVAPDMIQADVNKIVAPDMVKKPKLVGPGPGTRGLIGEDGKQALIGEDGKQALIGEDGIQPK